ncbi:protein MRG1-like isoform X2 [Coffea eugenioides]|nr:protein MRG1-like isoform X2 [Coffea eugenioides]
MRGSENVAAEDSTTVSDDGGATTVTYNDIEDSKEHEKAVDLPPNPPQHPPTQPQASPYQEGELVLAYHNQRVYPAKIMKVDLLLNEWRYSVHYPGWKKSWDEVVGMDRLMKYTEENRQKQQEHNKKQEMESNAKPGSKQKILTGYSGLTTAGARGKKRRSGSVQMEKAMLLTEKRVNIHIPPGLKKLLVHDWECVTHLGKLVKLPCSPNVDEVLSKYYDYRLKKDDGDGCRLTGSVGEVVNGLRRYFDKALPAMLLYKNERQQYEEAITDNIAPSAVYGAEHLLRLFVKLPDILHSADIEDTILLELQEYLVDFLKFLQKNQSSFFAAAQQSTEISDLTIKKQEV